MDLCVHVRMCLCQAQDPGALEQLSKNISRVGLTNLTLNYLRVGYNHIYTHLNTLTLLLRVIKLC